MNDQEFEENSSLNSFKRDNNQGPSRPGVYSRYTTNHAQENPRKQPKPEVYTNYIQPQHSSNQNRLNNNKAHLNNNYKMNYETSKIQNEQIKKPKFNSNSHYSNQQVNSNTAKTETACDPYASTFIGLDTFSCKNIFLDLIDNDLVLVNLDPRSKKNNFCFKGNCSIGLIYGQIKINGYVLKKLSFENENQQKWFELYSPETNSYLSIINNRDESQTNNENNLDVDYVIMQIKLNTGLNIDNQMEMKIREFLTQAQFSSNTSSVFVLRPLKAHMCNYLSYFENFQHVYQSPSALISSDDDKNQNLANFDAKLEKFNIFPIGSEHFNAIHLEREEEIAIFNEILSSKDVSKQSPVIMASGGKDVGKSTFLRYLVNNLLNDYSKVVAFIDCDPGQCEFTLSGCITLTLIRGPILGPPHTHISHSDLNKKCYFLGHLSPNDVPGQYLQCLRQCFEDFLSYKSSLGANEKIPLIINTMGWNQGLGLCLLKESILLFNPTHLIQINHPVEANKNMPLLDKNWLQTSDGWPSKKIFKHNDDFMVRKDKALDEANKLNQLSEQTDTMEVDETHQTSYKLLILKSSAPYKTQRYQAKSPQKCFSPRDHRNIAIITYFSKFQDPKMLYFKPIHHIRPYKISWSKIALHVCHAKVEYDQLFRIFNASLIGLCQVDPKYLKRKENPELPAYLGTTENENKQPIVYKCLGFGIVRGINMETKEIYVLTPEPIEVLNQVNLLSKGMLNLPLEFFYEQDSDTPCPYMSFSDNLQQQQQVNNLAAISNEPAQRKYLIHQTYNQQQRQQQSDKMSINKIK